MTATPKNELAPWARWRANELVIDVHVQPGARRSAVLGEHAARLKVAIHAPAADGMANRELLRLFGDLLQLRQAAVHLVRGATSRQKSIGIAVDLGVATAFVRKTLAAMESP